MRFLFNQYEADSFDTDPKSQYGKLKLPMCNGCVVLMDRHVCGWCGTDDQEQGRTLFNCSVCRRPQHEECQKKLRCKRNLHEICIVCELKLVQFLKKWGLLNVM